MFHIKSRYINESGEIVKATYADGSLALKFMTDDGQAYRVLSLNLSDYMNEPMPENHIFVKNYSEGEGLAEGMEAAGIAKSVGTFQFGPFGTTATLMEVMV